MVQVKYTGEALWARIERAVEKVKQRLDRVAGALNAANVPYAVVGGNAVQLWVAQVDETAVRNTRDVDIVLNRTDLPRAQQALETVGFQYQEVSGVPMFLDGAQGTPRDAVHIVFAGERVQENYPEPAPKLDDCESIKSVKTLKLEDLVRMKLTSHRLKDRVHIQDMIAVGLIDATWLGRMSPTLRERLKELLDNPEG